MSDFDFDELDRAVSGVIGDDSSLSDATIAPIAESSQVQPSVASQAPVVSQPSPAVAPAVRRSSGRFMDVVHPSSDMRSNATAPQVTRRQPVIVQPSAPVVEHSVPTPDPVDTLEDWQKPLESPFLPDMKVEKRPLGGEAPSAADFDALELLEAPDDPRIEAHVMPDPLDFAAQPAPETETLADVTSEPETFPEIATEAVVEEAIIETPKIEAVEASSHDSVGYGQGTFQTEEQQDIPTGPSSISQQYTEQPSSSPESGAIYDTEAYHQPLAPVAKKKSGAWVVLWILLIVLLGGGAGAAFYFYVMPML